MGLESLKSDIKRLKGASDNDFVRSEHDFGPMRGMKDGKCIWESKTIRKGQLITKREARMMDDAYRLNHHRRQ